MYEQMEHVFVTAIEFGILALEAIGAIIILYYTVKALISIARGQHISRNILTEGITTALSFLLCSEVLNTIIAPDWAAIGKTCAILLMRAAMTVLVHWEQKNEAHH